MQECANRRHQQRANRWKAPAPSLFRGRPPACPQDLPDYWLKRSAARYPAHSALVCTHGTFSYGSLAARVPCILSALPDPKDTAFVLRVRRRADLALALYACLDAGRPAIVASPGPGARSVYFRRARTKKDPESMRLGVATSGTTATPRIAMLSRRALAWSARTVNRELEFGKTGVWLNCLPLHHIGGISVLLRCLAAGATMVLQDRFEAAAVRDALERHRVTHVSLVPAMLARLLESGISARPPDSLRVALIGGGPLSGSLAERALEAGWPLYVSWGMTETASAVCIARVTPADWEPGCVGPPLGGVRISIRKLPGPGPRGSGRIEVRGPCVMSGYATTATPDPGPASDAHLSGDLGYRDERGALHVTGRADSVLVSGGENVQPEQVESVLSRCPGVDEVAVSALDDPVWGKLLFSLTTGPASLDSIERWAREHLGGAQRPRGFARVDRLPRNALGKLDRKRIDRELRLRFGPDSA